MKIIMLSNGDYSDYSVLGLLGLPDDFDMVLLEQAEAKYSNEHTIWYDKQSRKHKEIWAWCRGLRFSEADPRYEQYGKEMDSWRLANPKPEHAETWFQKELAPYGVVILPFEERLLNHG